MKGAAWARNQPGNREVCALFRALNSVIVKIAQLRSVPAELIFVEVLHRRRAILNESTRTHFNDLIQNEISIIDQHLSNPPIFDLQNNCGFKK